MTHPQIVVTVGATVFFQSVGLVALVWPEKMQRYLLKRGTRFFYFWPNPLLGWMKTSGYIIYLRVMGVVFLCFGLLVQFAALSDLKK
jgi:hypothetical protein